MKPSFEETLKPVKELLEQHGIDLENCWIGNEALICAAAINCLRCQRFNSCDFVPKNRCPNMFLTKQLPKASVH